MDVINRNLQQSMNQWSFATNRCCVGPDLLDKIDDLRFHRSNTKYTPVRRVQHFTGKRRKTFVSQWDQQVLLFKSQGISSNCTIMQNQAAASPLGRRIQGTYDAYIHVIFSSPRRRAHPSNGLNSRSYLSGYMVYYCKPRYERMPRATCFFPSLSPNI